MVGRTVLRRSKLEMGSCGVDEVEYAISALNSLKSQFFDFVSIKFLDYLIDLGDSYHCFHIITE